MPESAKRRSPRRSIELQIRVSGIDVQGKAFVEDSVTLVISRHGAKIRLTHKLIAEEEIHILCQSTKREGAFRVVGEAGQPEKEFSFWSVECLNPAENIWEGALEGPGPKLDSRPGPKPGSRPGPQLGSRPGPQIDPQQRLKQASPTQVVLRCSKCGMRELVNLDEKQAQALQKLKGIVRDCFACGEKSLWKQFATRGS